MPLCTKYLSAILVTLVMEKNMNKLKDQSNNERKNIEMLLNLPKHEGYT